MEERAGKIERIIRAITGVLAFLYFNAPVFADIMDWKIPDGDLHDFLFLASFPYDWLCGKFPNSHILRGMGQFIVFLIGWYLVFVLIRAIYEMLFEIYMDKQRFKQDSDEHDD